MDTDLIHRKDEDRSERFKMAGDRHMKNYEYVKAMESYNASLSYATPESPKLLIGYLDRATVYNYVGLNDEALQNCEMGYMIARDDDEKHQLGLKRNKCLESMEKLKATAQFRRVIPKECTPKLSFPPRRNLPFGANCLEIIENERYGRHIITTKDLMPGDIVSMEAPVCKILDKNMLYKKCTNCLKAVNFNLIPCQRCSMAMFCSNECEQSAFNSFHKYECPILGAVVNKFCENDCVPWTALRLLLMAMKCYPAYDQIRKMYDEVKRTKLHFNSFQFGLASQADFVKYILRLSVKDKYSDEYNKAREMCYEMIQLLTTKTAMKHEVRTDEYKDMLQEILLQFYYVCMANVYSICSTPTWLEKSEAIRNERIGIGFYPFTTLMNHSCVPNVKALYVGENSTLYMVYVTRPIRAGDQLFITYQKAMNFLDTEMSIRRENILREYCFLCECDACLNNYPVADKLKMLNIFSDDENKFMMNNLSELRDGNMEAARRGLTKYAGMIKKYTSYYPCQDVFKLDLLLDQCINILYRNRPFLYE